MRQEVSDLWDKCIRFLPAKERLSVSEFSEKHRWLFNEGGGHVGRWDNTIVPYLVAPMDELDNYEAQTIVIVGPGQSGKTTIAENWLMRSVDRQPGNFLWYMQTDDSLEAYVKNRIEPMVKHHEFMRDVLGGKPKDNSIHFKNFTSMTAEFLSGTYSNLINKSAPRIVADEIDAMPESLGNVLPMLNVRRQTFGKESKILVTSHPDRARGLNPDKDWTDGVMGAYADSDRRIWYWKCPHCSAWSSPCPLADRYMALSYPDEPATLDQVEDQACLVCPVNGCIVNDAERLEMNQTGKWIGTGQKISIDGNITGHLVKRSSAGFWIVGVMCPFVLGGIGALARAKAKAEREFEISGESKTLKEVMVKQFGFPFVPPKMLGSVTANELAARVEHDCPMVVVPRGTRFLTAAVDIQLKYFDVLVRGWGERGESWIIDQYRVEGFPSTNPDDWDELINKLLKRVYDLQDYPSKGMPIRGIGYDLSGAPGVSRQGYDAWARWNDKGLIRNYGLIDGKEAWSVIPTKGNALQSKKLTVTYPDTSGNKNRGASKGTVPVVIFQPNLFKDDLNGQLKTADDGPWYVHFPADLRSQNPPYLWFEQLVSETRDLKGRWEKINSSTRNEALDLMVMTHVIAQLHGLSAMKWDKPPPWAREWESNTFLVPIDRIEEISQIENQPGFHREQPAVKIVVQEKTSIASIIDMMP
jgi:phage terminase large subunit GpA-like protein